MTDPKVSGPSVAGAAAERSGAISARRRLLLWGGAVVALVVTVVFATVGDGVSTTTVGGLPGMIINHAHTLVWALLSAALTLAAVLGRWQRRSGVIAWVALATYLVFLGTVIFVD